MPKTLNHLLLSLFAGLLIVATTNCGRWEQVSYDPQPLGTTRHPQEALIELIRTAARWQPVHIERGRTFMAFTYATHSGLQTRTLDFTAIAAFKIKRYKHRVVVQVFGERREIFRFIPNNLAKAKAFVDVLEVLRGRRQKVDPTVTL